MMGRYTSLVNCIGKIWCSPYTLIGVLYGSFGYLLGRIVYGCGWYPHKPAVTLGNNAIQFLNNILTIPQAAIALGNTISYGQGCAPEHCGAYGDPEVQIGRHEEAHTWQYQVFGPFFIPVYFIFGGLAGPQRNPLERAAQEFGRGSGSWWPWSSKARGASRPSR